MKAIILLLNFISLTVFAGPVKIGASASLSTAVIYIAQEKNYFKDEGLETEIVLLNNSTAQMTTLLSKNELQVGAGNLIAGLFNAYAAGEKFKIVADKGHLAKNAAYIWLIVRKDLVDAKKVKSVKDLKGLKIGLPSIEGSSQQIALDKILGSEKLSLKDVQLVKMGYPDMTIALQQKNIDAAIQLEPFLSDAIEKEIAVKYKSVQDFYPGQQSAILIYSEEFSKTADAKKFMKAYLKGVADYNKALKNKELWISLAPLLNKYVKIDGPKSWGKMEPIGLRDNGAMDMDSIKQDLSWYKQMGFVKSNVTAEEIVTDSFIKKN